MSYVRVRVNITRHLMENYYGSVWATVCVCVWGGKSEMATTTHQVLAANTLTCTHKIIHVSVGGKYIAEGNNSIK